MKKLIIIAFAILILATAFQAPKMVSAATSMNLTGTWDILLFYNDGGMDREIWYITQEGTTITGHSRYFTDQGDVIRNRMTGILNGSYLTMSIKTGQDYVTEFKARIGDNGTTMGTKSTSPDGTSFQQTLSNIDAGRTRYSNRTDRWLNMNGQWWGQKQTQSSSMNQPNFYQQNTTQNIYHENDSQYVYQENYQAYRQDLNLTGDWDILLFYDDGGVNREVWYITQEGSLLTGHTRYRTDAGDVVRSNLTGRVNGSNLNVTLRSGNYTTQFQARVTDNGLSMGTKKTAPNGATFNQTMRSIDAGRADIELTTPNRYKNGDWWGHKRTLQSSR